HYTDFYGTSGTNGWNIAQDALASAARWTDAIAAWQAPYINDESKPLWYRGMLFNEMYIVADGGSFWGKPVGARAKTPDTFAFMECYDYPYYSSPDELFNGAMPVAKCWPELDKQVLRQFADTVPEDLTGKYLWVWKSLETGKPEFRVRKAKGAVPHDLGVPQEDAFAVPNQFSWQNTNDWKDLNSKFVLMVWRDYVLTGRKDARFLKYTWPAVEQAIEHLQQYDWNGEYFLYDTASEYKDNVQADQLAGQWYASMTGLGDLVPREMQLKALKKIFAFNVMKFANGEMGAVNGIAADGRIVQREHNQQVEEVWGGTTFALAALMLSDGMKDEAYRTAWGIYNVTYEKKGYWFRTPDAWDVSGNYRASMYMRPAAIWATEMTRPSGHEVAAERSARKAQH